MGDGDDDQLVDVVLSGQGAEACPHLLGSPSERALARVLHDGQLARGVRIPLGLVDGRIVKRGVEVL